MTTPDVCYTIWFRQRQGSTMLCDALERTGVAGRPGEWIGPYWETQDLLGIHGCRGLPELQEKLWSRGATGNGVLGVNVSFIGIPFGKMMDSLKTSQSMPPSLSHLDVWERIFPNHRHIHLTRRNRLRQAISWWKAIQTDIWHRTETMTLQGRCSVSGHAEASDDLEEKYDFNAIMHLVSDAAANESALQDAFSGNGITPLTLVYEDLVGNLPGTVHRVLEYLGISDRPTVEKSKYQQLSDDLSERWYERLLGDLSGDWKAYVEPEN